MGCLKSHELKKDGTLSTDGIKGDLAKEEHFCWKTDLDYQESSECAFYQELDF